MSVYYTTHPNLSITALVNAPTTEKARTTFLDYLERKDYILRSERQRWRSNMIAERMKDPESVEATIELDYGYEEGGESPLSLREPVSFPEMEEEWRGTSAEEAESISYSDPTELPVEVSEVPKFEVKLSPIAQIALGKVGR